MIKNAEQLDQIMEKWKEWYFPLAGGNLEPKRHVDPKLCQAIVKKCLADSDFVKDVANDLAFNLNNSFRDFLSCYFLEFSQFLQRERLPSTSLYLERDNPDNPNDPEPPVIGFWLFSDDAPDFLMPLKKLIDEATECIEEYRGDPEIELFSRFADFLEGEAKTIRERVSAANKGEQ